MEYDADGMFAQVAALAAKGWKIVRLWGVRDNLGCTCGRPSCPTPGKHPHGGTGWQHRATDNEEEIRRWSEDVEEHTRCNYGVRLGPTSGIIDVEFDSPEAEAVLKQYGLDKIDTPAYSSGRGVHRIFIHEDWMPDSAVVKVNGLEVRIGGGEMASQSVIPPSWHKSGAQYAWLPGRSPEDVNPAKLPDEFREAVLSSSRKQGSGVIAQAREALRADKKISEGGRHPYLVGIASKHAGRIAVFSDKEREELTHTLLAVNSVYCDPPKSRDEVCKIAADQFAHYRDKQIERRSSRPFERYGLEWSTEDHCWQPGNWQLTVVHSEPAEYKLRIPHPENHQRRITICLDAKEFVSPRDLAIRVLDASRTVDLLDPNPARWSAIWNGESVRNANGGFDHTRGLKCLLLEQADHEVPPPESNVSANNAAILLAYLADFRQSEVSDSDRTPVHAGTPKWIQNDEGEWKLWLKWEVTLEQAWRKRSLPPPGLKERRAIKSRLLEEVGEKEVPTTSRTFEGKQGKWHLFEDRHIEALRRISGFYL